LPYGHFAGDDVLQALAVRLRGGVRQIDLLGRLGGEEFAVALMETDMPAALETAERLRREIAAEPFDVGAANIQVTVSVGVASRPLASGQPGRAYLVAPQQKHRRSKWLVQDGRLRPLAVTSAQRVKSSPNLPTMAEAGVPGYDVTAWVGIAAPAGTPEPIIKQL
jgi:hypothetical protein